MGDDSLRLSLLRAAVERDPASAANWFQYGNLLLKNDFACEAAEALQKAFEIDPGAGNVAPGGKQARNGKRAPRIKAAQSGPIQ